MPGVYGPGGANGLNPKEHTIAERLKEHGYATMCIGKWHVGDQPEFLPTRQGFDHYFGIPYSNDMQRKSTETGETVVPLLRDDKVAELLTDEQQSRIVERYTDEAVRFITEQQGQALLPLSAAHRHPHADLSGREIPRQIRQRPGRRLDRGSRLVHRPRARHPARTEARGEHPRHLHQRQRPVADQGGRQRQRRPPARRQRQHLGRRRARAHHRLVARKNRAEQQRGRHRRHHRSPAHRRRARRWHRAAATRHRRPRHLAAAARQDHGISRAASTTTFPDINSRPCARDRGNSPSRRRTKPWAARVLPDADTKQPRLYNLDKEIGEQTNVAAAHPEIVAKLTALADKMTAEIGGTNPTSRRPAGKVENPKILYPAEPRKRPAKGKKK